MGVTMVFVEQIDKDKKKRDSKWAVVCPDCGHERILSYCQAYNIKKEISSGKCQKCSPRKSTTQFKRGATPWNKGISFKPNRSYIKNKKQMEIVNIFGQIVSEETRLKMSEAKKKCVGDKANAWLGGYKLVEHKRGTKEYLEWRDSVLRRDRHTCQDCGAKDITLCAHHILSFRDHPSEQLNIDNGETLCLSCHTLEHIRRGDLHSPNKEV